jgi:hypothetical protein
MGKLHFACNNTDLAQIMLLVENNADVNLLGQKNEIEDDSNSAEKHSPLFWLLVCNLKFESYDSDFAQQSAFIYLWNKGARFTANEIEQFLEHLFYSFYWNNQPRSLVQFVVDNSQDFSLNVFTKEDLVNFYEIDTPGIPVNPKHEFSQPALAKLVHYTWESFQHPKKLAQYLHSLQNKTPEEIERLCHAQASRLEDNVKSADISEIGKLETYLQMFDQLQLAKDSDYLYCKQIFLLSKIYYNSSCDNHDLVNQYCKDYDLLYEQINNNNDPEPDSDFFTKEHWQSTDLPKQELESSVSHYPKSSAINITSAQTALTHFRRAPTKQPSDGDNKRDPSPSSSPF